MKEFNSGVWPTMITPYTDANKIDWKSLDELVEWYIAAGVSGLFAVCLSSEIFHLSEEERVKLSSHILKRVDGRIKVISGIIPSNNYADKIKHLYETGLEAVIFLANQIFPENQDYDKSLAELNNILSKTNDIPLGIYESPLPYHKILTPQELENLASTGRFHFMKDTSCDIDAIKKKLVAIANTNCNFFNANTPTLLESLKLGAAGYSGIATNFYPELYVWLCENYKTQPALAEELSDFLRIADSLISNKYPLSGKVFQKINGIDFKTICRSSDQILTNAEISSLESLKRVLKTWHKKLSIY